MSNSRNSVPEQPGVPGAQRKPYSPPVLTLFGHVAALTQSSGCSASSDGQNAVCQVGQSSMGPMVFSDRRLKERIVRIGTHPAGFGLYLFDYKMPYRPGCGPGRRFGVMADEVEAVVPAAVSVGPDGYRAVDYAAIGVDPVR